MQYCATGTAQGLQSELRTVFSSQSPLQHLDLECCCFLFTCLFTMWLMWRVLQRFPAYSETCRCCVCPWCHSGNLCLPFCDIESGEGFPEPMVLWGFICFLRTLSKIRKWIVLLRTRKKQAKKKKKGYRFSISLYARATCRIGRLCKLPTQLCQCISPSLPPLLPFSLSPSLSQTHWVKFCTCLCHNVSVK